MEKQQRFIARHVEKKNWKEAHAFLLSSYLTTPPPRHHSLSAYVSKQLPDTQGGERVRGIEGAHC